MLPSAQEAPSEHSSLDAVRMAGLLGVRPESLPPECLAVLEAADFRYRVLTGLAEAEIMQHVEAALAAPTSVSGPERLGDWEGGWTDVERRFVASGCDPRELLPHYFRTDVPRRPVVRLQGRYVAPVDPSFEANWVAALQAWIAGTFLASVPAVYEFGCGPGHNLVAFARLAPGRRFVGLDWAPASQRILARAADALHLPVAGRHIDMFAPAPDEPVDAGAALVTMGAMEQLGERCEPFLEFLLAAAPAVCVHVEPIYELYDRSRPFDDAGARYHERRGYLRGFLPALRGLELAGAIELLHVRRLMGCLLHDGWSLVVWRPRRPTGEMDVGDRG